MNVPLHNVVGSNSSYSSPTAKVANNVNKHRSCIVSSELLITKLLGSAVTNFVEV